MCTVYVCTYTYTCNVICHSLHVGGPIHNLQVARNFPRLGVVQTSILERSFAVLRYPNKTTLNQLALQTGLREKQVVAWFARKRRTKIEKKCKGKLLFIEYYAVIIR